MDGYMWAGGQGSLQEKDKKLALMGMLGEAFPKPCLSRDRQKGAAAASTIILPAHPAAHRIPQRGCWSFLSTAQGQGAEAVVPVLVPGGKQSSRWGFFRSGHGAL